MNGYRCNKHSSILLVLVFDVFLVIQMVKQVEYDDVNLTSNLVDNDVDEDPFIYN